MLKTLKNLDPILTLAQSIGTATKVLQIKPPLKLPGQGIFTCETEKTRTWPLLRVKLAKFDEFLSNSPQSLGERLQ